jgi:hypothetical protein
MGERVEMRPMMATSELLAAVRLMHHVWRKEVNRIAVENLQRDWSELAIAVEELARQVEADQRTFGLL